MEEIEVKLENKQIRIDNLEQENASIILDAVDKDLAISNLQSDVANLLKEVATLKGGVK